MLENLYNNIIKIEYIVLLKEILISYIFLIKINNDFKKRFIKIYIKDF